MKRSLVARGRETPVRDGSRADRAVAGRCDAAAAARCEPARRLLRRTTRRAPTRPRSATPREARRPARRRLARRARAAARPRGARGRRPRRRAPAGPASRSPRRCPTRTCGLVESAIRHCRYLERAVEVSGLANVDGRQRAGGGVAGGLGAHDLVTARALAALPVMLEYAAPLLREGGTLVAWKGAVRAGRGSAAGARGGRAARPRADRGASPSSRSRARATHTLHVFRKIAPTPERFPRRPGWRASARSALMTPLGHALHVKRARIGRSADAAASVESHGHHLRDREPEGRGRQDDHRGQRRRLHRRGRLRDAARRRRPAGQRHRRARRLARGRPPGVYDVLGGDVDAARRGPPDRRSSASRSLASTPDLAGATMELPRLPGSESRLRDALAPLRERLRLHPARLPAVARAADGQRARRRRPGDRAGADRVLRARGPRRPARHARR